MKNLLLSSFILLLSSCSSFSWLTEPLVQSEQSAETISENELEKTEEVIATADFQSETSEDLPPYFDAKVAKTKHTKKMIDFCRKTDERFLHWGWGLSGCRDFEWLHVRDSVNGDPLMWTVFGDEKKSNVNMTLIMCGVHGDEITPLKFCYDILHYLNANFNRPEFANSVVVVFPNANPDSFFIDRPSRVNARGVDINRNLPTTDWGKDAVRLWKTRHRSDPRRFPGDKPMSEPETLTQVNMIKRYAPQKIISVHAPLTILDYDGPVELTPRFEKVGSRASDLLVQMSRKADGYEVRNYPFFPGSLGNYAGNERGIPTYTLELPSSDNRKHKEYWDLFRKAIKTAITQDLKSGTGAVVPESIH